MRNESIVIRPDLEWLLGEKASTAEELLRLVRGQAVLARGSELLLDLLPVHNAESACGPEDSRGFPQRAESLEFVEHARHEGEVDRLVGQRDRVLDGPEGGHAELGALGDAGPKVLEHRLLDVDRVHAPLVPDNLSDWNREESGSGPDVGNGVPGADGEARENGLWVKIPHPVRIHEDIAMGWVELAGGRQRTPTRIDFSPP